MKQGIGQPVFSGVAVGKAVVYQKAPRPLAAAAKDAATETEHFFKAKKTAQMQLTELYEKTRREIGEEHAQIIDVQTLMLDDESYIQAVMSRIEHGAGALEAVQEAGNAFAASFAAMSDEYIRARAADVCDASARIVTILCGGSTRFIMAEQGVLFAEDLSPSETVQLPKDKILAFVTRQGSLNSHTAILARMMGIPALVQTQVALDDGLDGHTVAIDGFAGRYYIDPTEAVLAELRAKQCGAGVAQEAAEVYRGKPTVSKTGKHIKLMANIADAEGAQLAMQGDAEGVGLMRSEFLYLGRDTFPTEDELYAAYQKVVVTMSGRRVIIRTLDIGADKQAEYFGIANEKNPALGYRGIRICLEHDEIFRPQMRAIFRAAALGPLGVMFPMITSLWEVQKIKAFCAEIKQALAAESIPYGEPVLGIMIETPAAALICDALAKEVDFFSVGTNDLTQYTLAIDRGSAQLDAFYDAYHPAVMALLEMIVAGAHKNGIWVGICGELGADASMTKKLVQMGFDELSIPAGRVLELRKLICESDS